MLQGVHSGKKFSKKRKHEDEVEGDGDLNVASKIKKSGKKSHFQKSLGITLTEEEDRLEKMVFGDVSDVFQNISRWEEQQSSGHSFSRNSEDEDSGVDDGCKSSESDNQPLSDTLASPERQPAWHDDEDTDICVKDAAVSQGRNINAPGGPLDEYTNVLKKKFESIMGAPKWAELGRKSKTNDSDDESDNELLQHCGNFLTKKSSVLNKGTIDMKRLKDLNRDTYTEGPIIKSVQFHPSATVALVAGLSGVASLFQVDGHSNTKLHSIQFERFPIRCARFSNDGQQFIVGSQHHSHYHIYDMIVGKSLHVNFSRGFDITNMKNFQVSPDGRLIAVCGRFGNIHLITIITNECIGTLKMNGEVTCITFNADGSRMFSHGDGGEVYVWDMNTRTLVHKFVDDGCIVGSSIALSPNSQYLACGSQSGVVNVYEASSLTSNRVPQPIKILLNLTTSVNSLKFNSASEILAMASDEKKDAIKLVHFPSMTVFSNFPRFQSSIGRLSCLDFSRNSGYLTVGNNNNTALLYRLKHYGNY